MALTTKDILNWLTALNSVLQENQQYLTQLDAAIGDADHGTNMARGFKAVSEKLADMQDADSSTILKTVGMTLVSKVGGASGPLYGTAFLRASTAVAGATELSQADIVRMLAAMIEGIQARGKAQVGEKTMLDALVPALDAAREAGAQQLELPEMLKRMSDAAETGMKATIPLVATKGRASYLGERSADHQDPGATSSWLMLKTLSETCG